MRHPQLVLVALVALACEPRAVGAQPDPLASYQGAPVYATYRTLYRAHWCLTNPARYAEIAKAHPDAAPRLKRFIDGRVTNRVNDSLAFLAIDVARRQAYFMKVDASTGSPDQTTWQEHTRAVAILVDAFLDEQRAGEAERVAIASGQHTMEEAIAIWAKQQASPWTSADELVDLTYAIKRFERTDEGRKSLKQLERDVPAKFRGVEKLLQLDRSKLELLRSGGAAPAAIERFTTPGRGFGT